MLFQDSEIREREDSFYKNIIRLYLKYGSVDEVFRCKNYELPISYPGMHHLLRRWGIVKSAGPNSTLNEAITFLTLLSDKRDSLEKLFKNLPPSFKTSLSTMYRIVHNVKEGATRRFGTALLITTQEKDRVLVGEDITPPNMYLGKPYGSLTLPMTYSGKKERPEISILRVLQQEVYTELAVEKRLPLTIIAEDPRPFMFLTIADIKVAVYHLVIPDEFLKNYDFTSLKVRNHEFVKLNAVLENPMGLEFRAGVKEIVKGYKKYLNQSLYSNEVSDVNLALIGV